MELALLYVNRIYFNNSLGIDGALHDVDIQAPRRSSTARGAISDLRCIRQHGHSLGRNNRSEAIGFVCLGNELISQASGYPHSLQLCRRRHRTAPPFGSSPVPSASRWFRCCRVSTTAADDPL
jgi:hypothetical protein